MLKNRKLVKGISDMSWSQFQTMLKYKVKWCSEQLVVISKTFVSRIILIVAHVMIEIVTQRSILEMKLNIRTIGIAY